MVVISDNIAGAVGLLGEFVIVALRVEKKRPVLLPVRIQQIRRSGSAMTHNQEKVDIVEAKSLQTLVESQLNAGVVCGPSLGNHKDVLTLDTSLKSSLEAGTDLLFVTVAVSTVDQLVTVLESICNGLLDLASRGLPGACSQRVSQLGLCMLEQTKTTHQGRGQESPGQC